MGTSRRALLLLPAVAVLFGCARQDMGWPRPGFGPNIEIGPQVACVEGTSARIVWRTFAPVQGDLRVRSDGAWRPCPGPQGARRTHDVRIDGLEPGRVVEYRLVQNGRVIDGTYAFRTPGRAPFRFAVVGDTGSGGAGQLAVRDQLAKLDPEFVLHVGDIAYEDSRHSEVVRRYFVPFADLLASRPFYVAWGNHDVRRDGGERLRKLFRFPESTEEGQERYYAFSWGDVRVWCLDEAMDFSAGSVQHAWLRADLAASKAKYRIVFAHYPVYSSAAYAKEFSGLRKRIGAEILPLLEEHDVDLYLNGHVHNYERTVPIRDGKRVGPGEGVVHVTTGGGGKAFNSAGFDWYTANSSRTLQCISVDVGEDALAVRSIDAFGRTIDEFRIPARP